MAEKIPVRESVLDANFQDWKSLQDGYYTRPTHDRTVIEGRPGRVYALRLLEQIRGILPIAEMNVLKADLSLLTVEERRELKDLGERLRGIVTQF